MPQAATTLPVNLRREKVEVFDRLRLTGCFLVLRSRFFISREYSLVIRLRNLEESPVVIFGETRTVCRWLLASPRLVSPCVACSRRPCFCPVRSFRVFFLVLFSVACCALLSSPLLSSQYVPFPFDQPRFRLRSRSMSACGVVWCGVMTGRRVLLPHQRAGDHVQDGGRVRVQPQEGVRGGTLKLYE